MFGLFDGNKSARKQAVRDLYQAIVMAARQPEFYRDYGVPDTVDGRFDMMLLHAFFVHERLMLAVAEEPEHKKQAEKLAQALFDYFFREMDKTLREMGIGDLSVPRHMKNMMRAYKGRLETYMSALASRAEFEEVLLRNLYRKAEPRPEQDSIDIMADYCLQNTDGLAYQNWEDVSAGRVIFTPPVDIARKLDSQDSDKAASA